MNQTVGARTPLAGDGWALDAPKVNLAQQLLVFRSIEFIVSRERALLGG